MTYFEMFRIFVRYAVMAACAVIFLVIMTGCGISDDSVDEPKGKLEGAPTEVTEHFAIYHTVPSEIGQLVEDLWTATKLCTGIDIDPPWTMQIDYVLDQYVVPDTHPDAVGAIWVEANYARIWQADIASFGGYLTMHEFIHMLLYLNGQDHLNDTHDSILFRQCAPGTNERGIDHA